MIDELVDIDDYRELKVLDSREIYNFIIVLIAISLFLAFIIFNFNFECYYKSSAIYSDNTISLVIDVKDLMYITNNSIIVINDKNYKYKIKKIDTPILNSNGRYTQNIILSIYDFKSVNNNIIEFKILYGTKTSFKIIKDFILGKGM